MNKNALKKKIEVKVIFRLIKKVTKEEITKANKRGARRQKKKRRT